MKRIVLVCSFVVLALVVLPAFALGGSVTVFEKVYVKPVGKPVTYTETFSVPAGVENCSLVVRNGLDGSNAVQNVYVWVNGVQAFGHRDFRKNAEAQTEVPLGETNTITVALQGQGDTFISVEIVGEQAVVTPPPRQFF